MATTAQRHAAFPKTVSRLKCSQHRASKMEEALVYCNKRFGRAAKKDQLLNLMMKREDEGDKQESDITTSGQWPRTSRSLVAKTKQK
ncbi:hypothetical protein B2J93_2151 [Marssonina coronariae]|uniref:Uncharacterized protein n=1 Tax=Diplocarpon coronariae TaxID=2795749 RepID=A0A218Z318_9HELO|nr:hypothetical protein B2J93_2151 [Marssonina coronariae]